MIYVTGDTHGDFKRFNTSNFPEQKQMTREDYVIILGDFGGVWCKETNKIEEYWLDWLNDKPFTTLFIDGNHENFTRLNKYPVKEYHGGLVNVVRPNVLHLKRGEIFNLENKTFFIFGGASSHDIQDGILDVEDPAWKKKAKQLDEQCRFMYRIKGLSWWEEELPSQNEMNNGLLNLEKHNNKVDYILTHCASASTVALLGQGLYEQDILTRYLQKIREKTEFNKWLFGHYHGNKVVNNQEYLLYEQIVRLL